MTPFDAEAKAREVWKSIRCDHLPVTCEVDLIHFFASALRDAYARGVEDGAKAMRRAVIATLNADSDYYESDVALAVLDATHAQVNKIDVSALAAGGAKGGG